MKNRLWIAVAGIMFVGGTQVAAQGPDLPPEKQFLAFIRDQAAQLRGKDEPPKTRAEWEARRADLREHLRKVWNFPAQPCPLSPRILGVLKRDGYRIEKLIFQTMPGVWMTANAYVPDKPGKHPALLAVHGHWKGARIDPVLQRRCIGPAKLGYFVLAVDAFGAGERGVGTKLGEYHGEMTAATLFPVGMPLSGIQVYENMRAVDYLLTRPEVDGTKIGITGASGGGNQTMYAGSWDDRFGAVVPVCSVGNYQAYLGPACCMCEVVPGALRFTEEWGILGMTAPRGLMVVNATKDGIQFSVPEAKKSLAKTSAVYNLYGRPAAVRHTIFDWHHDYSKAMREALYGWLALNLKGQGDGSPIPEPDIKTEDLEDLRCFPGDSRPADWMTIPRFAAKKGHSALLSGIIVNLAIDQQKARRDRLIEKVFGGFPQKSDLHAKTSADGNRQTVTFHPEPGLTLTARMDLPQPKKAGDIAILLDLDGADKAAASPLAKSLRASGWNVTTIDLRATGKLAQPGDAVGKAPDHNTAEWSMWIGRPLLGQWTWDVVRLLDALAVQPSGRRIAVIGHGPAGLVALCAGAVDARITHVAAVDALASYVSDVPYQGQRLGVIAPGILREVGDVNRLAALCGPRRVVIAGGVWGSGMPLTDEERVATFRATGPELRLVGTDNVAAIVQGLTAPPTSPPPARIEEPCDPMPGTIVPLRPRRGILFPRRFR